MHALDVLGDPVRRRILVLAAGAQPAGTVVSAISAEFGISQPGVSAHVRVLREAGFATVRPQGARRLYAVDAAPLHEVDDRLEPFRRFWDTGLDALGTELPRGRRQARLNPPPGQENHDHIAQQIDATTRRVTVADQEAIAAGREVALAQFSPDLVGG
jgi:DNA-binding transcriptional ArsR family regulator